MAKKAKVETEIEFKETATKPKMTFGEGAKIFTGIVLGPATLGATYAWAGATYADYKHRCCLQNAKAKHDAAVAEQVQAKSKPKTKKASTAKKPVAKKTTKSTAKATTAKTKS